MMRLIDADNIYNVGDFVILHEDGNAYVSLADLCKIIDIQPTVYDIDKVVEELSNADPQEMMSEEQRNVLNYAIEIVKQGCVGKDVE